MGTNRPVLSLCSDDGTGFGFGNALGRHGPALRQNHRTRPHERRAHDYHQQTVPRTPHSTRWIPLRRCLEAIREGIIVCRQYSHSSNSNCSQQDWSGAAAGNPNPHKKTDTSRVPTKPEDCFCLVQLSGGFKWIFRGSKIVLIFQTWQFFEDTEYAEFFGRMMCFLVGNGLRVTFSGDVLITHCDEFMHWCVSCHAYTFEYRTGTVLMVGTSYCYWKFGDLDGLPLFFVRDSLLFLIEATLSTERSVRRLSLLMEPLELCVSQVTAISNYVHGRSILIS